MKLNDYREQLLKQIEDAVAKFNAQLPQLEREIAGRISELLRDVEIKNGRIANTAVNLRKMAELKGLIEKTVLNSAYMKSVQEFVDAFEKVVDLQNKYFSTVRPDFTPSKFLKEVRKSAIDATIASLTESGLQAALIDPIKKILQENITSGARYQDMLKSVTDAVLKGPGNAGRLTGYAKTITTDALNQYSAIYSEAVTNDLGLNWYQWTGSLRTSSRILCIAMVKKRWFHRSEIPKLLKGDFPEFKELDGKIYDKTGLPEGMIEGTNESNFIIRRGGYKCNHQPIPVADSAVPQNLRDKFKNKPLPV